MSNISALENLPEIDMLKDEGITFDSILNDMIDDYEKKWKEIKGEELTLYPADSRRIMLNVAAGKLYQLATIINERHKLNFIQYMYGDFLKNWGANFGFVKDGTEKAKTVLRFKLSDVQETDVVIPKGTRATSGDQVFFETDEETVVPAGEMYVDTSATCTETGTKGNGYVAGQIDILADPVNLVAGVENTEQSSGGHDEYTDEELKELIYNVPDAYSAAGPEGAYEELAREYSANIVDAKIITDKDATVQVYIMLQNGMIPSEEYCSKVHEFIKDLKQTPDTDKMEVKPPEEVAYEIRATYYIDEDKKEIEDGIKDAIMDACSEFSEYTGSKIGRQINPNILVSYVNAAGGSRIEIEEPGYTKIKENEAAVCSGIFVDFGGFDKE